MKNSENIETIYPIYIPDIAMAAALLSLNIHPIEIKMLNEVKAIFIFAYSPRVLETSHFFYNKTLMLNQISFNNAKIKLIQIVNKLKEGQNDR